MSPLPAGRAPACVPLASPDGSPPTASGPRPPANRRAVDEATRELVAWVARHGVATTENLSIRFASPERTIVQLLGSAEEAGLLKRAGVLRAEPELFVATRAGLRAVDMGEFRVCAATPRAEGHLRAVASAAVWLELRFGPECEVLSERELKLQARPGNFPAGRRLASPYVHHLGGAYKRPDLLIRPTCRADGLPVAVEVELSQKSAERLRAICMAWNHCHEIAAVLYLVAPHLLKPLRVAIERAGAARRVVALPLHECDVPVSRRRAFYRPQPLSALAPASESCARGDASPSHVPAADTTVRRVAEMLGWVGRWGLVGLDSLALHLGLGRAELWETIERAERNELVRCAAILRAESVLCWATRRGLRAAGLSDLPTCAVNYRSASTCASLARIAALLEREHPGHVVFGIRELEARRRQSSSTLDVLLQPFASLWRNNLGRQRRPAMLLVADAHPRSPAIAAFVYAGRNDKLRLRALLAAWGELGESVTVIVYIARDSVRRVAARVLVDLRASDRMLLRPLPVGDYAPSSRLSRAG
jgi:hypothetical protein